MPRRLPGEESVSVSFRIGKTAAANIRAVGAPLGMPLNSACRFLMLKALEQSRASGALSDMGSLLAALPEGKPQKKREN